MSFLVELLNVFGRRTAGAGLIQTTARQQRHDRQHFGAGAELENREEVRQIVSENIAGH